MAAQIGYYDTLKSVAGKVFTFLSTLTLTGTDGKTVTVTQDTSLDEAVAMSSKAPKTDVIKGDGTAGRVMRKVLLTIKDGTTPSTIKCQTTSQWNGDAMGEEDNLAKGTPGTNFSLAFDGGSLILLNAGISGDCVCIISSSLYYNASAVALTVGGKYHASGLQVVFYNGTTGAVVDLSTLVDTGEINVQIVYVTSA
jgi:hypothetical protein